MRGEKRKKIQATPEKRGGGLKEQVEVDIDLLGYFVLVQGQLK